MSQLIGIARFDFVDGDVEEFQRLSLEARRIVHAKEPGTLEYAVYFNDDRTGCVVVERYRDSAALLEHSANLSHLMGPILATGSVSGELLGEPSEQLIAALAGSPVGLFPHVLFD